jgi:hypothetical protein
MILDGERRTAPASRQAVNIPNPAAYRYITDKGVSRVNGTVLVQFSLASTPGHTMPYCSPAGDGDI